MREERYSTVLVTQSCLTVGNPWTAAQQAPPSMGFSRQEYWSGSPFPSPGDLPYPGLLYSRQIPYGLNWLAGRARCSFISVSPHP